MKQEEKSLYENVKAVQEDFYEISNSLEFIKQALDNDDSVDPNIRSQYNRHLVSDMIEGLRGLVENSAEELFSNLGIRAPEESTSGEV